jgi:hypothetical protein
MNVNVGDKVYTAEGGEIIWGFVTAVDKKYVHIKWTDLLGPISHHNRSLEGLFFIPDPESLEDKIKELLG